MWSHQLKLQSISTCIGYSQKKHLVDQLVFVEYIFIWLLISITGKIDEYSQNNMQAI